MKFYYKFNIKIHHFHRKRLFDKWNNWRICQMLCIFWSNLLSKTKASGFG